MNINGPSSAGLAGAVDRVKSRDVVVITSRGLGPKWANYLPYTSQVSKSEATRRHNPHKSRLDFTSRILLLVSDFVAAGVVDRHKHHTAL